MTGFAQATFKFLVICCLSFFSASPATAATNETSNTLNLSADAQDFATWNSLAKRVEAALQAGRVSNDVLGDLRQEVLVWRDKFNEKTGENELEISVLRTKIQALTPGVDATQTEIDALAKRRETLEADLVELKEPSQKATEAVQLAQLLINNIDSLRRSRQTQSLLVLGPNPLTPTLWPNALADLTTSLNLALIEVQGIWQSDTFNVELASKAPILLALLGVAVVAFGLAPLWLRRFGERLASPRRPRRAAFITQITDILQLISWLVGVLMLDMIAATSELLGARSQILYDAIILGIAAIVTAKWIAKPREITKLYHHLMVNSSDPANLRKFRAILIGLAVILIGIITLDRLAAQETYEMATRAVLSMPLILVASICLYGLSKLTAKATFFQESDHNLIRLEQKLLVKLLFAISFIAPLLAAIGYRELGIALVSKTILTLALIFLVLELFQVFRAGLDGFFEKYGKEFSDTLLPILLGFVMFLASLPVVALIWGARWTDIVSVYETFLNGFALGETQVTPKSFLIFVAVFVVGYMITRAIQSGLKNSVLPKTRLDQGGQNAISVGTGYAGIFLAALLAITSAGIDLSSIALVAGALSVGIGFGLQNIISNFVSGIILLIERPISEGDWIEVGGHMGYVRDISVRSTRIETFDRTDVIVPNSDFISSSVTNFTRGNSIGRVIIPVGVAYGCDTRHVEKILLEIIQAQPMVTVSPAPSVVLRGFGADSIDFQIRAILSDINFMTSVTSDVNHEIVRRFAEEGIEIPFAQRDIWIKNPEALVPSTNVKNQTISAKKPEHQAAAEDYNTAQDEGEADD